MQLSEDVDCYASAQQREVLIQLADHPLISKSFFLTGGTALSVFYLHHRTSEDLDLFTPQLKKPIDLQEMVTFYDDCARRLYQTGRA